MWPWTTTWVGGCLLVATELLDEAVEGNVRGRGHRGHLCRREQERARRTGFPEEAPGPLATTLHVPEDKAMAAAAARAPNPDAAG